MLMLLLGSTGFAAGKKLPQQIKTDSSRIVVKKFDAGALQKFGSQKEFNYGGQSTGEPSAWDIFWQWVWSLITRIFSRIPYGGYILQYLLGILSVALLVYIILKSVGIDAVKLLRGESTKAGLAYSESLENINETDFDAEIERAIAKYNYRVAIRLLYLKCLKQLSDKRLINWQIDKTNAVYLRELTDPQQKQTFSLLTRQFEYVWYGDFTIDKNTFAEINSLFQNFNTQL